MTRIQLMLAVAGLCLGLIPLALAATTREALRLYQGYRAARLPARPALQLAVADWFGMWRLLWRHPGD